MPGEVERRIVSVLFCDLAGFTSLSERLDAEDVAIVQGAYFEAVRDAVTRHGGTLEKFIGDAAVAVYGVPRAREDDAERAVRSGLAIAGAVEQLSARLGLEDGELNVRVGVQSGEAVVHPSPPPGEAMVTGDVVNTAARLQSAAPLGSVLLGPGTALAVASSVELAEVGGLELKGKAEPVAAYRAIAALPEPERERAMGELSARTVGRERELRVLVGALGECAQGRTLRMTVVAPPGTGKSRLLAELGRAAAEAGADVRAARVRPDALAAFRPVADLVAAALASGGLKADVRGVRAALESRLDPGRAEIVADELTALLRGAGDGADAGEPDARRAARFGAWSDGLHALGRGLEVWLVEDVHWATPDFRAFVDLATDCGDEARGRLVVCTTRPSLLDEDTDWVSRGEQVGLEPLSEGATEELVRALVGEALPAALARRIAERSQGNPLFVEELLRSWIAAGLLGRRGEAWVLTAPDAEVALPSTVQGIYAAQLDDLPPAARRIVRRAAVAGRQFPVAALEPLEASDPAGLETLVRRGIAHGPVADRALGDSYLFRHALLRDVGYASLSRAVRARLHVRMARWLEGLGEERAADVAEVTGRHYAAALESAPALAGDVGDGLARDDAAALAARWFERAAGDALAASANDAARCLFARALELTASDDDLSRARRLVGFARSVAFTSDMAAGLEAATDALTLLRRLAGAEGGVAGGVREEISRAASLVGTILTQQLLFAAAVELAGAVLSELGDEADAATVRLLLVRIRGAAMIGDDAWDGTVADRARARELARALGDPELELEVRIATVWDEPDLQRAWGDVERLASELRRWPDVAEARRARAALCLPDDLAGVLSGSERLRSFARAHQLDELEAWSRYYDAEAHFAGGDWSAALSSGVAALDLAEAGSYHRVAARTWFAVVPPAAARSDRSLLERAAGWYARLDSFPDSPYGRISRTAVDIVLARHGLPSTFRVELAELGPSIAEGTSLPSWYEAVDVVVSDALDAGQVEDARRAVGWLGEALARGPSASGEAARVLLEARLLLAEDGDVEQVRERAAALQAQAAPWALLKCLRLLEEAGAADDGERAEARALEARLGLGRTSR